MRDEVKKRDIDCGKRKRVIGVIVKINVMR